MTVKMKTQNSPELLNTCVNKRQSNNYVLNFLKLLTKVSHEIVILEELNLYRDFPHKNGVTLKSYNYRTKNLKTIHTCYVFNQNVSLNL